MSAADTRIWLTLISDTAPRVLTLSLFLWNIFLGSSLVLLGPISFSQQLLKVLYRNLTN